MILPAAGWDLTLKATFERKEINGRHNPLHSDVFGASYVFPPMGSTIPALSGTRGPAGGVEKKLSGKPDKPFVTDRWSMWNRKTMSDGCRNCPMPESVKKTTKKPCNLLRGLYKFTQVGPDGWKKTPVQRLHDISFEPDEKLKWTPDPGWGDEWAMPRNIWYREQRAAQHEADPSKAWMHNLNHFINIQKSPHGVRPQQTIAKAAAATTRKLRKLETQAILESAPPVQKFGTLVPQCPLQLGTTPQQGDAMLERDVELDGRHRNKRKCRTYDHIRNAELNTGSKITPRGGFDSPSWSAGDIPMEMMDHEKNCFWYNVKMFGLHDPLVTAIAITTKEVTEVGLTSTDPDDLLENTPFAQWLDRNVQDCISEWVQMAEKKIAAGDNCSVYGEAWAERQRTASARGVSVSRETLGLKFSEEGVTNPKMKIKDIRKK